MTDPVIAVFAGGTSAEKEVSRASGAACAFALSRSFTTRLFVVTADALPDGYDPDRQVVFSTLHGGFGEDGGMQRLMDAAGGTYAGSAAAASALTIDKEVTKARVAALGIRVADGMLFEGAAHPAPEEVIARLGERIVLKPNNEGSSVGLRLVEGAQDLQNAFSGIKDGRWLVERRIEGRELSVGILGGVALGIVEIRPNSGIFDYSSKYTKGLTEYIAPAPIDDELARRVKSAAVAAFAGCGCRDFARIDFMVSSQNEEFLLEINTLPGMKETSLLPMTARCAGLDFTTLVREMVSPAVERFRQGIALRHS